MSHRTDPDPWPHRTHVVKRYVIPALTITAVLIGVPALYDAKQVIDPSPSVVDTQAVPKLPSDYHTGGLASVQAAPRALPPTAAAYTAPAPMVKEHTRYTPPPTVVRLVPVPVPVPQTSQPPLDVAPVEPEPAVDEADKPRRWEDHDGRDKHGKRDWKRDKTKPAQDTDETEKPGRVCVGRICVNGERREEGNQPKTDRSEGKRDKKQNSDGDDH